jgi:sulfate/thiosulfate-binding protein
MRISWLNIASIVAAMAAITLVVTHNRKGDAAQHLLNVSYDPTRELYRDLNPVFAERYKQETGSTVAIEQSHAGSSYQARQVIKGDLRADVVTLGLPSDIEALHNKGLIPDGWETRLPNHSGPYNSAVVFLVRHGNPHGIHDWPDLIKPGIEVILPDPKTSGNGKLAVLSAWAAVVTRGGTEQAAKDFLTELFKHAPFLDPAARMAGVSFAVEKKGDVQLAWENEALRERDESHGQLEMVYPPVTILAAPTVTWVDSNIARDGNGEVARAYLQFLFSDEAQEIIARDGYRPFNPAILEKHADRFPNIKLLPITVIASDWTDAQRKFFADNGILDAVYSPKPRTE